jgi:hypothetical protein
MVRGRGLAEYCPGLDRLADGDEYITFGQGESLTEGAVRLAAESVKRQIVFARH